MIVEKVYLVLDRQQLVRLLQDQEHVDSHFDWPNAQTRKRTIKQLNRLFQSIPRKNKTADWEKESRKP